MDKKMIGKSRQIKYIKYISLGNIHATWVEGSCFTNYIWGFCYVAEYSFNQWNRTSWMNYAFFMIQIKMLEIKVINSLPSFINT